MSLTRQKLDRMHDPRLHDKARAAVLSRSVSPGRSHGGSVRGGGTDGGVRPVQDSSSSCRGAGLSNRDDIDAGHQRVMTEKEMTGMNEAFR